MPVKIIDQIEAPPTIFGAKSRAWECSVSDANKAQKGVVAAYLVEAAWAHPAWHSYLISVSHLRQIDGAPAPEVSGNATHQVWVFALEPSKTREPLLAGDELELSSRLLWPMNFSGQFIARDDTHAANIVRMAIRDICDGYLSPDTDFERVWAIRFGRSQFKPGLHADLPEIVDFTSTS